MINIIDDTIQSSYDPHKKPPPVGSIVKVTTNKRLLSDHGLDNRRDHPDTEFRVKQNIHHLTRWVSILDDKDDLWYPPEVLIIIKQSE